MSTKNSNKILIAIMIGYAIIYMDKQFISLAMVPIAKELSLSPSQIGDVMAYYFIGYSVMQIPSGLLADKIGSKTVLMLSLLIAALSILFFSTISVVVLLAAIRLVLGIGHAGYPSSATKTIATNFAPQKRVFAQSMILSTAGIGGILAATLGALLLTQGWRFAYVGLAILYVAALLIVTLFVPKVPKEEIKEAPGEKISAKTIFMDSNIYFLFIGLLTINIVLYGVMSRMPTYLTKELAVASGSIALIVGINAILTVVATIFVGMQLSKLFKNKEKQLVLITSLVAAVLLPIFVLVTNATIAIIILVALTIFAVAAFTTLFTLPHKIFSHKVMGFSFGIVSTGGTLGGFVANKVIGSLVESSGGYMSSFIFMSVSAVICGLSILFIKKRSHI